MVPKSRMNLLLCGKLPFDEVEMKMEKNVLNIGIKKTNKNVKKSEMEQKRSLDV